jgi:hypothetical protein
VSDAHSANKLIRQIELDASCGVASLEAIAVAGAGRAILELVDELKKVGELLRERLPAPLPALPVPTSPVPALDSLDIVDGPRCVRFGTDHAWTPR